MFSAVSKVCKTCKSDFEWTAGEQKFMQRLYDNGEIEVIKEPNHCPNCRAERKKNRQHNTT